MFDYIPWLYDSAECVQKSVVRQESAFTLPSVFVFSHFSRLQAAACVVYGVAVPAHSAANGSAPCRPAGLDPVVRPRSPAVLRSPQEISDFSRRKHHSLIQKHTSTAVRRWLTSGRIWLSKLVQNYKYVKNTAVGLQFTCLKSLFSGGNINVVIYNNKN